jgi:hypothetical protein
VNIPNILKSEVLKPPMSDMICEIV